MNILSHISYPALFFMLMAKIFGIHYCFWDLIVLISFSIFVDFDLLFRSVVKQKGQKFSFSDLLILTLFSVTPDFNFIFRKLLKKEHFDSLSHHEWLTHSPLTYSPLLAILFFRPNLGLFLVCLGIYSHFILDSFFGGGIMWLYPFSKKALSFFQWKFRNLENLDYFAAYKKTIVYKIDLIAFLLVLIKLFSFWI